MIILVYSLEYMCIYQVTSRLAFVSVSYIYMYVPIVMYHLRLFIVVLQELQCLICCLHVDIIRVIHVGIHQFTKFHLTTPSRAKCIARGCLLLFYKNYMYIVYYNVYHDHKGAIAPLYIGMVRVGQHRSHTLGKSAFPW